MSLSGISIITAVRNREERLADALKNWKELPGVDEIVVCDWSSSVPVTVPQGVKLVRVESEPHWRLSMAFNLAAHHATGAILLKMDVDYRVTNPSFALRVAPEEGQFSCGNANIARHPEDRFLCGCVCVRTSNFFAVNGYNERLVGYGYDDDDLYNRLREQQGLTSKHITSADGIFHLPHSNRHSHQKPGGGWGANKRSAKLQPWSVADHRATYSPRDVGNRSIFIRDIPAIR